MFNIHDDQLRSPLKSSSTKGREPGDSADRRIRLFADQLSTRNRLHPLSHNVITELSPQLTQPPAEKTPIKVCVTGAAGHIAYALVLSIANGNVFGADQPIILTLLDIPVMAQVMHAVVMELEDCALPLLVGLEATTDPDQAFKNIDWALLVGAMPRREGMLRKDLLHANVGIFKIQGEALQRSAKPSVRVVVVGNPANTNAMICAHYAPNLPKSSFSALTRLDENRAKAMIAKVAQVSVDSVHNVTIWGNHSNTQFPDAAHAYIDQQNKIPVAKAIPDANWLKTDFVSAVALRGGVIIKSRKLSSAMSAAKAVADHVRDWHFGTPAGKTVSMAVVSDGSYGIPKGLVSSFPVTVDPSGKWSIVQNLDISEFAQQKINASVQELEEERDEAFAHIQASA